MRSSAPDVRNPLLKLKSAAALRDLPWAARAAIRAVMVGVRAESQRRADAGWCVRRVHIAARWKCLAIYSGHVVKLLGPDARAAAKSISVSLPDAGHAVSQRSSHFRRVLNLLPGAEVLGLMPKEACDALGLLLLELRGDARLNSVKSWGKSKSPMASYWICVSVYAGLAARGLARISLAPARSEVVL